MFLGLVALFAVFVRGANEGLEERMRLKRLRLKLRVELAAKKIRMLGRIEFHDLNVRTVRSGTGKFQPGGSHLLAVFLVELVAVTVTLADLGLAVGFGGQRSGLKLAGPCAEAHGAT